MIPEPIQLSMVAQPAGGGGAEEEVVVDGGGGRHGRRSGDEEAWRRWAVLVATVWIQAVTGTNFDFSAYSSALKSSLGVSQEALNYLATASDLGKAVGWSSGLALLHMPLHAVLAASAAMGLAAYAVQYYCLVAASSSMDAAVPYPLCNSVDRQQAIGVFRRGTILSFLGDTGMSKNYFLFTIYPRRLVNTELQLVRPQVTGEEMQVSQAPTIEDKTIDELLQIDPDMFPPQGFRCTVTVSRLKQDSKWWFPSCTNCSKSSSQTSTGYQCKWCKCTETQFRYKLSFIATDGTSEAEFFCFDSVAKRIVGKSCQTLISTTNVNQGPPPDLAAIVSLKFTFAVAINMSAFSVTNRVFSILSVLTNHGRQTSLPRSTQTFYQQEILTQDSRPDIITTQESPATSFAKLSTSTDQESMARRKLTYSETLQDTSDNNQVSDHPNPKDLPSPPKKMKTNKLQKQQPGLTEPESDGE